MSKEIIDFIGEKVIYDQMGQMILAVDKDGGQQMFLDVRGWGHIQNMFPMTEEGQDEAAKFQDKLGQWVADTLNNSLTPSTPPEGLGTQTP